MEDGNDDDDEIEGMCDEILLKFKYKILVVFIDIEIY